jgi:hypothetical protein
MSHRLAFPFLLAYTVYMVLLQTPLKILACSERICAPIIPEFM